MEPFRLDPVVGQTRLDIEIEDQLGTFMQQSPRRHCAPGLADSIRWRPTSAIYFRSHPLRLNVSTQVEQTSNLVMPLLSLARAHTVLPAARRVIVVSISLSCRHALSSLAWLRLLREALGQLSAFAKARQVVVVGSRCRCARRLQHVIRGEGDARSWLNTVERIRRCPWQRR